MYRQLEGDLLFGRTRVEKATAIVVLSLAGILLTAFIVRGLQRKARSANRNLVVNDTSVLGWLWTTSVLAISPPPPSTVNVLTYHNDVARTGQNLEEKILTPGNVNSARFGKFGFLPVDGLVDAEPLYISNLTVAGHAHNVVLVATEHDSVYAFDADNLDQLWRVTLLGPNEMPSDDRNCPQITPEIGITSTPVIAWDDKSGPHGGHGVMYLVAMSKDDNGNYFQRLHALNITDGAEISGKSNDN